ncbi:12699_t:CDS:10, partial [Acaulospora morrowiae]
MDLKDTRNTKKPTKSRQRKISTTEKLNSKLTNDFSQSFSRKDSTQSLLPVRANDPEIQISSFFKSAKQHERSNFQKSFIPRKRNPLPTKPKSGKRKKIADNVLSSPSVPSGIFDDFRILFIQDGIDNTRLKLMKTKVKDKGGDVVDVFDSNVTHVITALSKEGTLSTIGLDGENIEGTLILQPDWISASITNNKLANIELYRVENSNLQTVQNLSQMASTKRTRNDTIGEEIDKKKHKRRNSSPERDLQPSPTGDPLLDVIQEAKRLGSEALNLDEGDKHGKKETSQSSKNIDESSMFNPKMQNSFDSMHSNPNKFIIDKLQVLLDHYQVRNDKWRVLSYRKAISAIKNHKKPITSYEEAKKISGIGNSIASKIAEIVKTGNLKRIESIPESDDIIAKFSAVHGVGSSVALKWYAKGYRTFDDILKNVELTPTQKAGIECFEDLQQRIPRDEVKVISKVVEDAAHGIDPKSELFTTGSYRRGNSTCGDIDILITRNDIDGKTHFGIIPKLVKCLNEQGILTHDLSQPRDDLSTRYMGICKLPGGKFRRIDFFSVPYNELGAALISYTGDDIFNRSMRLLAKKKNMKLNHHGLYENRGGAEKLIAQKTEKEIFDALERQMNAIVKIDTTFPRDDLESMEWFFIMCVKLLKGLLMINE